MCTNSLHLKACLVVFCSTLYPAEKIPWCSYGNYQQVKFSLLESLLEAHKAVNKVVASRKVPVENTRGRYPDVLLLRGLSKLFLFPGETTNALQFRTLFIIIITCQVFLCLPSSYVRLISKLKLELSHSQSQRWVKCDKPIRTRNKNT